MAYKEGGGGAPASEGGCGGTAHVAGPGVGAVLGRRRGGAAEVLPRHR